MELRPGTLVAKTYEILQPLGRGGMGAVFTARNIRTERRVALKLLHADTQHRSKAVVRFQREARAVGMISSENVTQVLDVEEDPKFGIVIAFELLEGESLLARLRRTGPMSLETIHPLVKQILRGLADAHAAGVIHRDLKPSNIFLEHRSDGSIRVKILDFGISKLPKMMAKITLTEPGQSLGSLLFMPPEQVHDAVDVDARADLYALGTLVFQSMTGYLPFSSRNAAELLKLKSTTEARTLSSVLRQPVPAVLETWIARTLRRDPAARFTSALEAAEAWEWIGPVTTSRSVPLPSTRGLDRTPSDDAHSASMAPWTNPSAGPSRATAASLPPISQLPPSKARPRSAPAWAWVSVLLAVLLAVVLVIVAILVVLAPRTSAPFPALLPSGIEAR